MWHMGTTAEIKGTRLLQEVLAFLGGDKRILVFQGGTRSSKSYSIAQGLIIHFQWMRRDTPPNERFRYSVMRKRMPSLKGTAMRDYFEVMERHGWYSQKNHNKTDNEYREGNVETEFLSLDDPQKIRGRKRNVAWLNEANEFTFEDFKQIAFRTTDKLILDYNPSEEYHWIYDKILTRDDVHYVQSTYRDNPFLTPETVREIEWLQEVDENAWRIYGMGERGSSGAAIYPRFEICDALPGISDPVYGVDFGYNEPSAVVQIERTDIDGEMRLYMKENLYETKLTVRDMISRLGEIVGTKYHPIYADSASPDRIEEIFRAGFNIIGADKRNYSVKDGIDFIKRHKIYITADSENLIREARGYKWKQDNQDRILDEPVKFRDHALDAVRYAAYTHHGNPVTWLME